MTYIKTIATAPGESAQHVECTAEETAVLDALILANQQAREMEAEQARVQAIKDQLDALDLKSIRALRTNDVERLATIEAEAVALRALLG